MPGRCHHKDGILGLYVEQTLGEARHQRGHHQPENRANRPLDHGQCHHTVTDDEVPDVSYVVPHAAKRLFLAGRLGRIVLAATAWQWPDEEAAQHDGRGHADEQPVDADHLGQQWAQDH